MTNISCFGILSGIFIGDLCIKNKVEKSLAEGETRELFGGRLLLRRHHNRGAALNFGVRKRPVIAALSLLLTAFALGALLLSLGQKGNGMLKAGLSLLVGGAFSNTYDRLKRKYVVDYISFGVKWKGLRKVVFNVSDFCIIIGALLAAFGAGR